MSKSQEIGRRIKYAREAKEITQEELSSFLGMNKSTIQRYETGQVSRIKIPVLHSIAKALNVSADWISCKSDNINPPESSYNIFDTDNVFPLPKLKKVPLIGSIACGTPILAEENIEDYLLLPEHIDASFVLRCKGDSMKGARIYDGDLVYIRQQPCVENGEIAAVLIENEATLKRVYYYKEKNMLILKPENTNYEDMIYTDEELNKIRIIGKAVAFISEIK